jgi:exopolysaccharide biosynthesis polyprenyl glycosylphosphotransferase
MLTTAASMSAINSSTTTAVPIQTQEKAKYVPSADWVVFLVFAGDFVVVTAALVLAIINRQYIDFGLLTAGFVPTTYFKYVGLASLTYVIMLQLQGGYQKHMILHKFKTIQTVFKTSAIWAAIFLGSTLLLEIHPLISRIFTVWAFINTFIFICTWRMAFRRLLFEKCWASILKERVLVVGWSKESDAMVKQMRRQYAHPYELIGCTPSAHGKFWVTPPKDVPVLGDYNSTAELLIEHKPAVLILADLDPVMGEIVALAELCYREHVQFKVIPSYFQIFASGLHLESISGVPVMGVSKLPLDYLYNRILKRTLDVIGALVGLVISAPIIAIFGYLVYKESPGPIFYKQDRMGRGGRLFKICKIRSMRLDAEKNGAQRATANDNRRLVIGAFMRKYNIDEVPQFWNVLKGEMSLVGPRPEILGLIPELKGQIRHYGARHSVKAGMTGWAQIHGLRGDTDLTERIRFDLYYVENWVIWLDLYIMAKTFFVRSNAY